MSTKYVKMKENRLVVCLKGNQFDTNNLYAMDIDSFRMIRMVDISIQVLEPMSVHQKIN